MGPEDYDIKALRDLLAEVEVLLFPNDRRERPVISYEVREGSVRHLFLTGVQAVAQTGAVLGLVASTGTIDVLEPRTAKAIEALALGAGKRLHVHLADLPCPAPPR